MYDDVLFALLLLMTLLLVSRWGVAFAGRVNLVLGGLDLYTDPPCGDWNSARPLAFGLFVLLVCFWTGGTTGLWRIDRPTPQSSRATALALGHSWGAHHNIADSVLALRHGLCGVSSVRRIGRGAVHGLGMVARAPLVRPTPKRCG